MTASLPPEIQQVFDRFITTEFTTVAGGQPITWPVTPYYRPGDPCIDLTTGLGYPKKANDARADPKVGLLFSDPTGSGTENPPQVLVQGIAEVDDHDLDANRERYWRESWRSCPPRRTSCPRRRSGDMFRWYFNRIYVHVRPERVYVWRGGNMATSPSCSTPTWRRCAPGHEEEPDDEHAPTRGAAARLGRAAGRAGRSATRRRWSRWCRPTGSPSRCGCPSTVDQAARRIRLGGAPVGVPWQPGLACVTAHDHAPDFTWQRNFQVRGDLVEEDGAWAVVPAAAGGRLRAAAGVHLRALPAERQKVMRFRKIARREMRNRSYAEDRFFRNEREPARFPLDPVRRRCSTDPETWTKRKERGREV